MGIANTIRVPPNPSRTAGWPFRTVPRRDRLSIDARPPQPGRREANGPVRRFRLAPTFRIGASVYNRAPMDGVLSAYIDLCLRTSGPFKLQIARAVERYTPGEWQRQGLMKIASAISDLATFGGTPEMADRVASLPLPVSQDEFFELDEKIAAAC